MSDSVPQGKLKQRSWNPQTLERILSRGISPDKEMVFINVFYAKSHESADNFGSVATSGGLLCEESQKYVKNDSETYWVIHTSRSMLPKLELVNEMTDYCWDIATSCDVEYDGWYAVV